MERRIKSNSNVFRNNSKINNNIGFAIDSSDIIDLNNFSDNASKIITNYINNS